MSYGSATDSIHSNLSRLGEACLRISGALDSATVLQEVVDSACSLTGARYGVLLTHEASGAVKDIVSSGTYPGEFDAIGQAPQGDGLLGYLDELRGPIRLSDISDHPRSVGFPAHHPHMKNFLGMPILHGDERVGNIYLAEKSNGSDFTADDEEAIVMFAAQAAAAISNARRYDEERRSREDLQTLLNISPVGVVVFDAQTGDIVSINPEAKRIFGGLQFQRATWEECLRALSYRRSDGRELSLAELPLTRVLQNGETVRAEEMVVCLPDGRSVTTLVNAAPIYSERGVVRSVVVAVQDMTPLQDVERMRGEFLGLVSQELRTPLSTIKGSIVALEGAISSQQTEAVHLVRIIEQQTDLMRNQINSLIELTHIQTGTLPIAPEPTQLAEMLEEAGREFRRSHVDREIETSLPTDLPPIAADRRRMAQALQNALVHASQHTHGFEAIKVKAMQDDGQVVVSMHADFGHGTAPAQPQPTGLLDRIHPGGVQQIGNDEGLALAISKGIIEAHGGRIWVEEDAGGNSGVLTLRLPVHDGFSESEASAGEQSGSHRTAVGHKPKILVAIEDSRALAAVRRVLTRAGYRPIPTIDAASTEEAAAVERPEALLLDVSAPMAGNLELVRRMYDAHKLPIIVLVDRGADEQIVKAFEMGAEGYIVKPFSSTELVSRIEASLRKRASDRGSRANLNYRSGQLLIDYDSHIVTVTGRRVQLTATEYKLLFELSSNAGRVLTQDELLQRIWGPEYRGEAQLLRAYVKTLRQKLGDNARKPSYIFTEHGIGYRMAKP